MVMNPASLKSKIKLLLGYLPHDMLAYAFYKVNKLKGTRNELEKANLRPEIQI